MFETIEAKREPLLARVSQNLSDYREPLFALAVVCIFVILRIALPVLAQSGFESVWFREGADVSLPAEIKIHVAPKRDALTLTVPVPVNCGRGSYEIVTLQLDGELHPVSGGIWDCTGILADAPAYSAKLNRSTIRIQWAGREGSETTDTWTLTDGGRTITISRSGRRVDYRKASWFRSLFTAEP